MVERPKRHLGSSLKTVGKKNKHARTCVSPELPTLQSSSNIVLVANGSTSSVDKPGALFEVLEKVGVNKAARTLV